jgi:hypothetical protein
MLFSYCDNKECEVEGYPFEKRLLSETNPEYDKVLWVKKFFYPNPDTSTSGFFILYKVVIFK